MNNTPKTEEYERCIVCGSLTCVPISTPIDWRENYEIGLGQLCPRCANNAKKESDVLSDKQILLAVEQRVEEN